MSERLSRRAFTPPWPTCVSTFAPENPPLVVPSARTSILVPTPQGAAPIVLTTVATAIRSPLFNPAWISLYIAVVLIGSTFVCLLSSSQVWFAYTQRLSMKDNIFYNIMYEERIPLDVGASCSV